MLGRLRMTIKECLGQYYKLSENIFDAGKLEKAKNSYNQGAMFNAEILEREVKKVVREFSGTSDEDEPMLDPRPNGCKV
jgi:hypothetical protein